VTVVLFFLGTKLSVFFGSLFSYLTIFQLIRAVKKEIKIMRLHAKTLVSDDSFRSRILHTTGFTLLFFVILSGALFVVAKKRLPYGSLVQAFVEPVHQLFAFIAHLFDVVRAKLI
jgi:hypothetical protein